MGAGFLDRLPARDTAKTMPQENVETVRRIYEGYWDRHDRAIYGPLLHPDVELVRV